jgi:hypothetical protein
MQCRRKVRMVRKGTERGRIARHVRARLKGRVIVMRRAVRPNEGRRRR